MSHTATCGITNKITLPVNFLINSYLLITMKWILLLPIYVYAFGNFFPDGISSLISKHVQEIATTNSDSSQNNNRYIIQLVDSISIDDINRHIDDLSHLLTPIPHIHQFKGVIGKFIMDNFKGYFGEFPEWIISFLKSNSLIKSIEQDIPVSISQNDLATVIRTSVNYTTQIQINPPWGLDRITHRELGFEGRYIYPNEPG